MLVTCRTCGLEKPHTREFFYFYNSETGVLHKQCIICTKAYTADCRIKSRRVISRNVCWLEFECGKCQKVYPHWFKSHGERNRCRGCDEWRSAKRKGRVIGDDLETYREKLYRRSESAYLRNYRGICKCVQCGSQFEKESLGKFHRGWRCLTCEKINNRMRRHMTKKFANSKISYRIRRALKAGADCKSVFDVLGYSIADLKKHLERQFRGGMDWEKFNEGQIHIDHIIPQSKFSMDDPEQFRKCWCLSNLQPMWASENMRKSDKMLYLI